MIKSSCRVVKQPILQLSLRTFILNAKIKNLIRILLPIAPKD